MRLEVGRVRSLRQAAAPRSSPCARDPLSRQAAAVQTLRRATPGPTGEEGPHEGLRAWGLSGTRGTRVPSREGRRESPAQARWALPWCE